MQTTTTSITPESSPRAPRPYLKRRLFNLPAEFTKRLEPFVELDEGQSLCLQCEFVGVPAPVIAWYKDAVEIPDDHPYYTKEFEAGVARLVVEDILAKDEGAFKCKAENTEGAASTTSYVTVIEDKKNKLLSQQQKDNQPEHCISLAPHLRTITEQKSLEEREAEVSRSLPRSPIQDFIDNIRRDKTWPLYPPLYQNREESIDSQISDTIEPIGVHNGVESDSEESTDSQNIIEFKHQVSSDESVATPTPTQDIYSPVPPLPVVSRPEQESVNNHTANTDERHDESSVFKTNLRPAELDLSFSKLLHTAVNLGLEFVDSPHVYFFLLVNVLACLGAVTHVNPLYFFITVSAVTLVFLKFRNV